jgi:hypothetical protein
MPLIISYFSINKNDFSECKKYEHRVKRFVLSHSQSPKRAKQESDRYEGGKPDS